MPKFPQFRLILVLFYLISMIQWSVITFSLGFFLNVCIFAYFVFFKSLPDLPKPQPRFVDIVPESSNTVDVDKELKSVEGLIQDGNAQIGKELESIVNLIIKDFVEPWFTKIDKNSDAEFLKVIKWRLLQTLLVVKDKLMKNDSASLIVLKLLPIFNKHFSTFCDAREAVLSDLTLERHKSANIDLQIAVEFNKNYKIHKSLSLKPNALQKEIEKSIRKTVIGLLPHLFDNDELDSLLVFTLMTEVLTTCIISPLIFKFTDPDSWNLRIVSLSQNYFEEKHKVHKIRRMLSKELQDHRKVMNDVANKDVGEPSSEKLELNAEYTGKQFEHYLNQLDSLLDLSDIKYVAYSLALKIYQLKENEHLTKENLKYKKRLLLSLNLIESKLSFPGSEIDTASKKLAREANYPDLNMDNGIVLKEMASFLTSITLKDIVDDSEFLPFFESFLGSVPETQGSTFLEYSQTIESFKNPLEDATSEDIISGYSGISTMQLQEISSKFFHNNNLQNMKLLDEGLVKNIILFRNSFQINNDEDTFILARKSVLLLQTEAIKYLDDRFLPLFKKTPSFLKMLSTSHIISTDIYAHFLSRIGGVNNPEQNKIIKDNVKTDFMNPVRIFANPGITDALDNIVNGSGSKPDKSRISSNPRYSQLFGSENDNIFKDKLFDDENDNTSEISVVEDQLDHPRNMEKVSVSSGNSGLNPSQFYGSNNFRDNIASLTISIDQIEKELELLRHLILKADLTNNQMQLKILKKSQRTLLKELEMKELLKQQYMVQENGNSLFRKTKIYIRSYFSENSSNGLKEITYYIINIHHFNNGQVSSWDMARRYNEFFELNTYLKKNFRDLMRQLQDLFPSKVKMSLKYHVTKTLLYEERKQKLEKYLRELLSISEICEDNIFRRFLTDPTPFKLNKEYMHDDILEEPLHEPIGSSNSTSNSSSVVDLQSSEDGGELNFYEDERHFFTDSGYPFYSQNKSFVKQICDLFISLFALNKANAGWLRGRAIITVLQQLLGSTIEKYIKVSIQKLRSEDQVFEAIVTFKNMLWGDNGLFERKRNETAEATRSEGERLRTEQLALTSLQRLFADTCGRVVGLRDSHEAAGRVHAMLQNPYLNASLLLEALDAILLDIICND
ncbi:Mdm1p [Saccharomyces cerevisiae YJM1527]|nr:Mdm1p [Saccharomyces cerevisiae YJM456]AJS71392.1 Mdm1p [Saccharomyces cerevisiae YJM689]AJS84478.1 Mdm1p [Saccharomyces cerevisiae YJM1338]AJS98847.1 Mdm1p [Saccharomyces cerevisiae YJM1527]CAI4649158.1 BAK_1a_G0039060.mRNA.1.CDS.1 [Saccharomyces cerevisiae]